MTQRPSGPPLVGRLLLRLSPLGDRRDDVIADMRELFVLRMAKHNAREARRRFIADAWSLLMQPMRGPAVPGDPRRRLAWLRDIPSDIVYTIRIFRRQAGITAVALAGLAVAIGLTTTAFSLNNAYNFQPAGVADPQTAVRVFRTADHGRVTLAEWTYASFLEARAGAQLTRLEGAYGTRLTVGVDEPGQSSPRVQTWFVTDGFFDTFGGTPAFGRLFDEKDARPGAPVVTVLNYRYWRNQFGADRGIIGREIRVGAVPATVIGVVARDFTGPFNPNLAPAAWLPLHASASVAPFAGPFTSASNASLSTYGRLRSSGGEAAAASELSSLAGTEIRIRPAGPQFTTDDALMLTMLMTVLGLVVVLAGANVANLIRATVMRRLPELRTRLALGAGRARLVRQLLTESLVLAFVAGAFGVLTTNWFNAFAMSLYQIPPTLDPSPDWRVYLFVTGISALAGCAAGLAPALKASRGGLTDARRSRNLFLATQSAASTMLLVLAFLFTRGLIGVLYQPLKFDPEGLIQISAAAPRQGSRLTDRDFYPQAMARLRELPGIEQVALTEHPPFDTGFHPIRGMKDGQPYRLLMNRTDEEYFGVLNLELAKGRVYSTDEVRSEALVAVISAGLEAEIWPGGDALGKSLGVVSEELKDVIVIGVLRTRGPALIKAGMGDAETVFRPITAASAPRLIARLSRTESTAVPVIRQAMVALDPDRFVNASRLSDDLDRAVAAPRVAAATAGIVGGTALVLAIIGVFGITAVIVDARRKDIGVRLALGSTRSAVVFTVFKQGMRPIMAGLACGLTLALIGSQAFASLLFAGVGPRDPAAIAGAVLVLLVAASAGVLIPARRAAAVDPAQTLRAE